MEKLVTKLREELFDSFNDIDYLNSDMEAIKREDYLSGTAFFPIGDGLFKEDKNIDDIPIGGIMIVGQDFGTRKYLKKEIKAKGLCSEVTKPGTWPNIIKTYFNDFNIPKDKCFFTNSLMDLRKDEENDINKKKPNQNNVGKMISHLNKNNIDLLNKNRKFLIEQIKIQKPKIIIFLGNELLKFCDSDLISNSLKAEIKNQKRKKFKKSIENVYFESIYETIPDILFLTHPCIYSNYTRKYDEEKCIDIERKMVSQALEKNKFI